MHDMLHTILSLIGCPSGNVCNWVGVHLPLFPFQAMRSTEQAADHQNYMTLVGEKGNDTGNSRKACNRHSACALTTSCHIKVLVAAQAALQELRRIDGLVCVSQRVLKHLLIYSL